MLAVKNSNTLYIGEFTKATDWSNLTGGAHYFTGWQLKAEADKVTVVHGTADGSTFTPTGPERKLEVTKDTDLTDTKKCEGATVSVDTQTVYFTGDAQAFELRRLVVGDTKGIWLRIGERGKEDVVQKGWMCQVCGIVDTEVRLAVRFELDVKGDAACTHVYAGQVDAFGIPHGHGVLQKQGDKQGGAQQSGEFRLGKLVLGAIGDQKGFFLDECPYGDAKFQAAVTYKAEERSIEAKKLKNDDKEKINKRGDPAMFAAALKSASFVIQGGGAQGVQKAAFVAADVHGGNAAAAAVRGGAAAADAVRGGAAAADAVRGGGGAAADAVRGGGGAAAAAVRGGGGAAADAVRGGGAAASAVRGGGAAAADAVRGGGAAAEGTQKGHIDAGLSQQVRAARDALNSLSPAGADEQLVATLKQFTEKLFGNGEEFVLLESGSVGDVAKHRAALVNIVEGTVHPCETLMQNREASHPWVKQYVRMVSLQVLSLLQYICTSGRMQEPRLCTIRESVEKCLAFARQP